MKNINLHGILSFICVIIITHFIPAQLYSNGSVQQFNSSGPFSNLNDPAPRNNLNRTYKPIKGRLVRNIGQTQKGQIEYFVESWEPDQVTGQILIQLSQAALAEAINPTIKILAENSRGEFSQLIKGKITNNSITATITGSISKRFKIVLSNVTPVTNPVESVDLQGVVLSDRKRIMLIGDSITDGKFATNNKGYRHILYDKLRANQHDIDFVGSFGDDPYSGHFQGGKRIVAFYPRYLGGSADMDVTGAMNGEQPNIVAIHLGTNDINNSASAGPYIDGGEFTNTIGGNMAQLVNYILSWNNGEKGSSVEQIIVSLIVPAKYLDSTVYAANKEIAKVIRHFQSGEITGSPEPVVLCDHFTPFYEYPGFLESYYKYLMADKLHPNEAGHRLMAETYYKTIVDILTGKQYWFQNNSWELGITGLDTHFGYQGVSAVDVNDDEKDDLYIVKATSDAPDGTEEFYLNSDDLPFEEKAVELGIDNPGLSRNGVFVDIENDGDFDVFVSEFETGNKLYENRGNGQFQDITSAAGISDLAKLTTGVISFDCDNDGDMDLFAINSRTVNEFYINNGLGRFQKQGRGLDGIEEPDIASSTASAADFDNDGDIDIYVVKRFSPNILYVNDGYGYFSDGAEAAGVAVNDKCNGAFWADMDNDANLDLIVSLTESGSTPLLYFFRNKGNGTFENITNDVNIPMDGYSSIIADFDNDGFSDIVITNISARGEYYQNNGNWDFTKIEQTGSEINSGEVRGAAVFDYEQDGDMDIIAARKKVFNIFIKNNLSNSNNYLKVKAKGPLGDIGGFGTKLWLFENRRLVDYNALLGYKEILTVNGHLSQHSPTQHFGLGFQNSCDLLAQFMDGTFVIQRNVISNQTLSITPIITTEDLVPEQLQIFAGDAQADTVSKDLAVPLEIKVVNKNGHGVSNVVVDFEIFSGDATLFLPPQSGDAVSVEAESAELSGFFRWATDATTSGDGLVFNPQHQKSDGEALLTFSAPAGIYYGWARILNPIEPGQLDIDLSGNLSITLNTNQDWQWVPFSTAENVKKEYSLAGDIDCVLETDLPGIQIDKLLFVQDVNFTPIGLGESSEDPLKTDREGIARRFVQLGTKAGHIIVTSKAQINNSLQSVQFSLFSLPGSPSEIFASAGNNQTGRIEEMLPGPLEVTVLDAFANPTPFQNILFETLSGGTITPTIVETDTAGKASASYTPSRTSSIQEVSAKLENSPQLQTTFTVHVQGVADRLEYISGDNQTAIVNKALTNPIKVQLFTESNLPAVNYQVSFKTLEVGARLSAASDFSQADSTLTVLTDSTGIATVYWQLGTRAGTQKLVIDAGEVKQSPLEMLATAFAEKPGQLLIISGNNQEVAVQQDISSPFAVHLMDLFSNPIANYPVHFQSIVGGGHFNNQPTATATTDSSGHAFMGFTLGTQVGKDVYVVRTFVIVEGDTIPPVPLEFFVNGLPGPPMYAKIVSGNNQLAVVNTALPQFLTVEMSDEFANVVPEEPVRFEVTQGNGKFVENSIFETMTDPDGLAKALFTVGSTAGQNIAKAVVPALENLELYFYSTGVPDAPVALEEISGNNQQGAKNRPLREPFTVKVRDVYDNGIGSHPVKFTVQGELGKFGSSKSITVATDSTGLASTFFTLGNELGEANHVVQATAQFNGEQLENTPITFLASAIRGLPHKMLRISEKNIIGAAQSAYPIPVSVKVVDLENTPVENHDVVFEITNGDGQLFPNSQKTVTVITDYNGEASAIWFLGSSAENHKLVAASVVGDSALINSPMEFFASAVNTNATSLLIKSGNGQSAKAGEKLSTPLAVQVTDNLDLPVSAHPVHFVVSKGDGKFESGQSELLTETDIFGIAQADFILGGQAGEKTQAVYVNSSDVQGHPLINSPVNFSLSATPAAFDADSSSITVTTPIPSNGIAPATITVTCRDRFANPVPGVEVELFVTPDLNIQQKTGITNYNGQFVTTATLQEPGEFTIQARELSSGQQINDQAILQFIQTDAQKAEKIDGDNIVYVNSVLRDTLTIKITNTSNEGVSNFPVTFYNLDEKIELLTPQPVFTNNQGLAKPVIKAKNEISSSEIIAFSPGLENDSLIFPIEIRGPNEYNIHLLNESLEGKVASKSDKNFKVRITDIDLRPIGLKLVDINSDNEEIAFPDSASLYSNEFGIAQTGITFGKKSGTVQFIVSSNNKSLTVPVVAFPDSPKVLLKATGDLQTGPANSILSNPLTVALLDLYNNPIPNQPIRFVNQSTNGGFLSDSLIVTNQLGQSTTFFTLGSKAGRYEIRAEVLDLGISPVYFYVNAEALSAASMVLFSGNYQQGVAGHKLNGPVVVKVLDTFGNSVENTPVEFAPLPGSGTILPSSIINSDSLGLCRAQWVLGPSTGKQFLFAVNSNLENSPITFTAQAASNTAPIIETVADTFFVNENELLKVFISANDAQDDSVLLSIAHLPTGALFSQDSSFFFWLPGFDQAGQYVVKISGVDIFGATGEKQIYIIVNNVNRPPIISAENSYPQERFLGNLEKPAQIPFAVFASDPDNDPLTFRWYVNNELRANTSAFNFRSESYNPGFVQVKAVVSDVMDTDSLIWTFDVISSVELKYFSGLFEPFTGVRLSWETSAEHNNLGFYVLRSAKKEGPFHETGPMVPSNKGVYEFVDSQSDEFQTLYYAIEDVQQNGSRTRHEIIKIESALPDEYKLFQNYPNPFNGTTTVRFQLPQKSRVRLTIYDVLGRTVRTLVNSKFKPGYYSFQWDGKNDQQLFTASGIYYIVFSSPGKSFSKKLLYIK